MLRLPPQNKPHATFAQPLQCVLQQQVRIHAAITLRFASTRCRTPRENQSHVKMNGPQSPHRRGTLHRRLPAATLHGKTQGFVLLLPPPNKIHATFAQPLQCVLQQQVRMHAAITLRFASTRCRTPRENQSHVKMNGPQSPHRRGTLHRRLPAATLHGKTQGFVLLLPPPNKIHAISVQPLQCAKIAATRTHSCSHYLVTTPLPKVTNTSLSRHSPKSPHSLRHHFPGLHFPSSPLPFVTLP